MLEKIRAVMVKEVNMDMCRIWGWSVCSMRGNRGLVVFGLLGIGRLYLFSTR